MVRTRRTRLQKTVYAAVYVCPQCGLRLGLQHRFWLRLLVHARFLFSRHSCCLRCGSYAVDALTRRDYVDSMSRNVLGVYQLVLGAPLKRCPACRLQYYDWRPVREQK